LAAAAVFEMGEGAEQTPIAIIEDVDVEFDNVDYTKNNPLEIKKEIDIYYPLIKNAPWKKGRGKK
jgi:F420-0:gamma-glutamyl ligase